MSIYRIIPVLVVATLILIGPEMPAQSQVGSFSSTGGIVLPSVVPPIIRSNQRPGSTIPSMRKFMEKYLDEYIPLYMKTFYELNPKVDKNWYPTTEAILEYNQGVVKNLSNSQVPVYMVNGSFFQTLQLENIVHSYTALGRVTEVAKKLEDFQASFSEFERKMGGKPIAPEKPESAEEKQKVKSELTRLETQIRQLKIELADTIRNMPTQIQETKSSVNWLSIVALLLAIIALIKKSKVKEK